jgi:hypothetical protein
MKPKISLKLKSNTTPVTPIIPISVSSTSSTSPTENILPPTRQYSQLTKNEETILLTPRGQYEPFFRSNNQDKILKHIEHIVSLSPIPLPPAGFNFIDQLIVPPAPIIIGYKGHISVNRRGRDKSEVQDKINTILLAVKFSKYPNVDKSQFNGEFACFRVERDDERKFTDDGRSLVIKDSNKWTETNDNTHHIYGVIPPDTPMCLIRHPTHRETVNNSLVTLLQASIADIFQAIENDPQHYFATMGKLLGICMVCARDLSDDKSKERGYGPTCWKWINQIQRHRQSNLHPPEPTPT